VLKALKNNFEMLWCARSCATHKPIRHGWKNKPLMQIITRFTIMRLSNPQSSACVSVLIYLA